MGMVALSPFLSTTTDNQLMSTAVTVDHAVARWDRASDVNETTRIIRAHRQLISGLSTRLSWPRHSNNL